MSSSSYTKENLEYGKISVVDSDYCIKASESINSLSSIWIEKTIAGHKLNTLGLSAIADSPIGQKECTENNNMLLKNFRYLYENLISSLNKIYGKCSFMDNAPLPGFFIYGGKEGFSVNNPDQNSINVHTDNAFDRLDYLFSKYKEVDHKRYIAVTLSIKLPLGGAGLMVWDQKDKGLYSNNKYSYFVKQIKFSSKDYNNIFMRDHVKDPIPNLIEYTVGDALYMDSNIVHAVSHGVDILKDDQRITMQAFGIKCDGVWRLLF